MEISLCHPQLSDIATQHSYSGSVGLEAKTLVSLPCTAGNNNSNYISVCYVWVGIAHMLYCNFTILKLYVLPYYGVNLRFDHLKESCSILKVDVCVCLYSGFTGVQEEAAHPAGTDAGWLHQDSTSGWQPQCGSTHDHHLLQNR